MGALINVRNQYFLDHLYDLSGTIASGGTPQLIFPVSLSCSSFIIQNISDTAMYLAIGAPPATCTLSNGAVSSVTVGNAGFGYSIAPIVHFYGGCNTNRNSQPTYLISGLPEYPAPSSPATAHCVMSGSAPNMTISSIVIDNPGSGYAYPPFVFIKNNTLDPFGCSIPTTTNGILLQANGGSYTSNGTVCTTDQMALYCATTGKAFTMKFSA